MVDEKTGACLLQPLVDHITGCLLMACIGRRTDRCRRAGSETPPPVGRPRLLMQENISIAVNKCIYERQAGRHAMAGWAGIHQVGRRGWQCAGVLQDQRNPPTFARLRLREKTMACRRFIRQFPAAQPDAVSGRPGAARHHPNVRRKLKAAQTVTSINGLPPQHRSELPLPLLGEG